MGSKHKNLNTRVHPHSLRFRYVSVFARPPLRRKCALALPIQNPENNPTVKISSFSEAAHITIEGTLYVVLNPSRKWLPNLNYYFDFDFCFAYTCLLFHSDWTLTRYG